MPPHPRQARITAVYCDRADGSSAATVPSDLAAIIRRFYNASKEEAKCLPKKFHGLTIKARQHVPGSNWCPLLVQRGRMVVGFTLPDGDGHCRACFHIDGITIRRRHGLDGAFTYLQALLPGVTLHDSRISRLDLCADVADVPISEFIEKYRRGCITGYILKSLSRDYQLPDIPGIESTSLEETGWSAYSKALLTKFYNKGLELQHHTRQHQRRFLFDYWDHNYGWENPLHIVRIEFQLRRNKLQLFDPPVRTIADCVAAMEPIWSYLTDTHVRLTESPVDRQNGNQRRAATWSVWADIQTASTAAPIQIAKRKPGTKWSPAHQALAHLVEEMFHQNEGERLTPALFMQQAEQLLRERAHYNVQGFLDDCLQAYLAQIGPSD